MDKNKAILDVISTSTLPYKRMLNFCKKNKEYRCFATLIKERKTYVEFCVRYKLYLSSIGYSEDKHNKYDENMALLIKKLVHSKKYEL